MRAAFLLTLLFGFSLITKGQTNLLTTKKDGKHTVYHTNGNIKAQGNYLNNQREGEWLYYYENGKMALKKNFSKGIQVGEWVFFNQDGSLGLKIDDIAKIDDKVEVSHEKNSVTSKTTYLNGKKEIERKKMEQVELNNKF